MIGNVLPCRIDAIVAVFNECVKWIFRGGYKARAGQQTNFLRKYAIISTWMIAWRRQ
jgi:hypothetical protein